MESEQTGSATGGGVDRAGDPSPGQVIGRRYRIVGLLGRGGMGSVYEAVDLLAGAVALKRLGRSIEELERDVTASQGGGRPGLHIRSLADEFRTMASLRHPNIVSVLDYGIDERQRPFLVMELLAGGLLFHQAAKGLTRDGKVELLVQMLRALAYLHRRDIVHRDLKPGNVLVVDGQVKVLDFGIATMGEPHDHSVIAGTPGYIAPEVLRGRPATERSDLYAVGVMAREILGDESPPALLSTTDVLVDSALLATTAEAHAVGDAGDALATVIQRLGAPDPVARFASADEAIAAFGEATGRPLAVDTAAVRESFLQAAPFVGREVEKEAFRAQLAQAMAGRGSAWLVTGESGVGKSRLVDEVRLAALLKGVTVLRGQEVGEAGGPYEAFRAVLRSLSILGQVTDHEAGVLRLLVPDIELLLGRPVAAAVELDSETARVRLVNVVEDLFGRQGQPLVVILEDLQWAGGETLKLLGRLAAAAASAPLLLLATCRDDERPRLAAELPAMRQLRLKRLGPEDIARLGESMIGGLERRPEIVELLRRETEGNPFFLVEVVRAMAEEAGGLDRLRDQATPPKVRPRRLEELVQRRLLHVPVAARALLEVAAVLGRQIDLALLAAAAPEVELVGWIGACAEAAVIDIEADRWRFAHDKLREGVLATLSEAARPALHRRAALAIVAVYPEAPERFAALAYHFGAAGDEVREADYCERAGDYALRVGACQEAVDLFARALVLLVPSERAWTVTTMRRRTRDLLGAGGRQPVDTVRRLARVEGQLAEAHFQLGDIEQCRVYAGRSVGHLGRAMPEARPAWIAGTLAAVATRAAQAAWPAAFAESDPARRQLRIQSGRVHARLIESYFYLHNTLGILWSGLGALNVCEPAGPSAELARGYAMMAVVADTVPLPAVADIWSRRAVAVAERAGGPTDRVFVAVRTAVHGICRCRWDEVTATLDGAIALVDELGDIRQAEECRNCRAMAHFFRARFAEALPLWSWVEASSRRRGGVQWDLIGPMARACNLARLGRFPEAVAVIDALRLEGQVPPEYAVNCFGSQALSRLRLGDLAGAATAAEAALRGIQAGRPVAYWNQMGTAMAVETLLTLWERDPRHRSGSRFAGPARAASKGMRVFGDIFLLGHAFALLWSGTEAWLDGNEARAWRLWRQALVEAKRLGLPYEEARARLEIGRHLPPGSPERAHHLRRAQAALRALGDRDLVGEQQLGE